MLTLDKKFEKKINLIDKLFNKSYLDLIKKLIFLLVKKKSFNLNKKLEKKFTDYFNKKLRKKTKQF